MSDPKMSDPTPEPDEPTQLLRFHSQAEAEAALSVAESRATAWKAESAALRRALGQACVDNYSDPIAASREYLEDAWDELASATDLDADFPAPVSWPPPPWRPMNNTRADS